MEGGREGEGQWNEKRLFQHGSEPDRNREPGTGKTEANRIGEPVKGCEPANRLNSELAEPRTGMPGYQDATFLKITFFSRIGSS